MIVAEESSLIKKTTVKNDKGALPFNLGSYYNEFQIINYLGEDIHAIDHLNQVVIIKPQEKSGIPLEDDRCIIIQYRHVQGPRIIGDRGMEITHSTYCTMTIPRRVLLEDTIFVEEINALLFCPKWHPNTNLHPHSKEHIALQHERIRYEIARKASGCPITIMANDPTGEISSLHIELNGQVYTVKVTNFNSDENEKDLVVMGIRGSVNGDVDDLKIVRTSFTDLLRQNPLCWEIGGFLVSRDRHWLENKLNVEKVKPVSNGIPSEEVKNLLNQAKAEDKAYIENLSETVIQKDREIKELKSRYKTLHESYDDLVKNGYMDRNSEFVFRKLDVDEENIKAKVEEAKINQKTERIKFTKENLSTIATVAKTIAVIIPLVVLYLKYKKEAAA